MSSGGKALWQKDVEMTIFYEYLFLSIVGLRVQSELGSILLSERHAYVKAHLLCQAHYRNLMGLFNSFMHFVSR